MVDHRISQGKDRTVDRISQGKAKMAGRINRGKMAAVLAAKGQRVALEEEEAVLAAEAAVLVRPKWTAAVRSRPRKNQIKASA